MKSGLKLRKWVYVALACVLMAVGVLLFPSNKSSEMNIDLGNGLVITEMNSYSGKFVEDGSDENVSNIMSITVTNNGDKTLQYAEITLSGNVGVASFSLSTLPVGKSVTVLEATKKTFTSADDYVNFNASNVVYFNVEPTMYDEFIKIQALDGAFNVLNKTTDDITGNIFIYYKNKAEDGYLGGITYRARIEGLTGGEIKQVMTNHYSTKDSEIMFVTIGQ